MRVAHSLRCECRGLQFDPYRGLCALIIYAPLQRRELVCDMSSSTNQLRRLEQLHRQRGERAAADKLQTLLALEAQTLPNARQVFRLHEALCFLRAYPDDPQVLRVVVRMLNNFCHRVDLRRHAKALSDTGIAGTAIYFPFYYPTADWLSRRWPQLLRIDWSSFYNYARLEELLPLLLPTSEAANLDEADLPLREWLEQLAPEADSSAKFLLEQFRRLNATYAIRQKLFEDLNLSFVLISQPTTPSRTLSHLKGAPLFFVHSLPKRDAPWRSMAPQRVEEVSTQKGARIVELARMQMITRSRDLYAFMHSSNRGVRVFDMGSGLQFACIGLQPPFRFTIETLFVYIALQSGVPVGYVQATSFLGSAEINFNVFDSFRGAQARHIFRAVLGMVRHDLGCHTFIMNTQQLGIENPEAIRTGAWWFYYKQGFRPRDPVVIRLMNKELAKRVRRSKYRSPPAILRQLACEPLYLASGRPRKHNINNLALGNIGLRMSSVLGAYAGISREQAVEQCVVDATRELGVHRDAPPLGNEKLMWQRWAPLVRALPGLDRWSRADKRAIAALVKAKAASNEADYLRRADAHPRLARAIVQLSESSG